MTAETRLAIASEPPAPALVARSTAYLMDLYFMGFLQGERRQTALGFFATQTLDGLYGAERGFYRNLHKIDRVGLIDPIDLERFQLLARQDMRQPAIAEDEAFGFMLVTFSVLPELATSRFLPKGFSRRTLLAPPFTTREFFLRVKELRQEVSRIVAGQVTPKTLIEGSNPLWRTYLFFQVGGDIPMHIQQDRNLVEEATEKVARRILESTADE